MSKEIKDRESKEFKLAAYEVYEKIEAKQTAIDAAVKNLRDAAKSTSDFKKETLKEIMELRSQIASGAIQMELIS